MNLFVLIVLFIFAAAAILLHAWIVKMWSMNGWLAGFIIIVAVAIIWFAIARTAEFIRKRKMLNSHSDDH